MSNLRSEEIKITVIISFCGEYCDFNDRCLASLKIQDFTNFEIILILDGPTRFRSQLYSDLNASGLNFQALENPKNLSLLQSRARASVGASGEYIAFLDHDDTYEPNFLSEMYHTAITTGADVVECPILEVEPNGEARLCHRFHCGQSRSEHNILLSYFLGHSHNNLANKLIRNQVWTKGCKEVMSDLKDAYINYYEDAVFTINVYNNARLYVTTCDTHYNYIKRSSSAVNPYSLNAIRQTLDQVTRVFEYINDKFAQIVGSEGIDAFYKREASWTLDHLESRLAEAETREPLSPDSTQGIRRRIASLRRLHLARRSG